MTWTRTRAASALALGTASALLLSACGTEEPEVTGPSRAPVSISVGYYGNFGLVELEETYEKSHPWVDLTLETGAYAATHDALQQAIITGSGAPTVMAIDEGYITGFVSQPEAFVNMVDMGANDIKDKFLPWAWAEAANADQSVVIGIPNNVYGLALCYRADLFEAAGLESERDAVSAAMSGGWEDFISEGQKYFAATGKPFLDDATTLLNPAVVQLGTGYAYYDKTSTLDIESIKPAFEIATNAISAELSANLPPLTEDWNAQLTTDAFAATLCPQWMLGYIGEKIGTETTTTAKWDVAELPGPGGNQGGSFFTLPKGSTEAEQQAGYEFIQWLMEPEQQVAMMKTTGTISAQKALLDSAEVKAFTSEFFNSAPYGTIYSESVLAIPAPVYYAPNNLLVRTAVEGVLIDIENGNISIADAWEAAVAAAEAADLVQ
jgi:cellobiose transport system substrate-binding protein